MSLTAVTMVDLKEVKQNAQLVHTMVSVILDWPNGLSETHHSAS